MSFIKNYRNQNLHMKRYFNITLILIFLLMPLSITRAQQNPSGIDWKEIDTGTYRIVFPPEIEPLGQYVANLMVHYEKYNYKSMITRPRKIPIVLINQYSQANGFVSTAPFYSHWFTTPSSFDSIEWFKGLAVHEGRHMAQINKLKDGAGKGAWRVLAGPLGTAAFQFLYVPTWFMEGDAVTMETALTRGGRGRLPSFDLWHRTLELSGKRYSYYRSYLGARDDLYPYADYYRLGYILCSYVRNHYGLTVWNRVLERTGKYFLFPTFDSALETETGKDIDEIYQGAMDEYRSLWMMQSSGIEISGSKIESPLTKSGWHSYLYPHSTDNGRITALHFTRNRTLSLVEIKNSKVIKNIRQIPFSAASSSLINERGISFGGDYALWNEQIPDPRWQYRTYSDLRLLNTRTGDLEYLTDYGKYTSSSVSGDGRLAVAVNYGPEMKYRVDVIRISDKKIIEKHTLPEIGHIYDPSVSRDRSKIAFAVLSTKGNALFWIDRSTGNTEKIIDYTFKERMKSPVFSEKYIFYVSDYSGIDNIYALDRVSKERYRVTSRPFGAYFPSLSKDGNTLLFNDYSVNGYSASSMKIIPSAWMPLNKVETRPLNYIDPIAEQELGADRESVNSIPDKKYQVENYSHLANAVNVMGWFPFFNSTDTNFSISLISRDILHTIESSLSYTYNFNENTNAVSGTVIYSGFYPVLKVLGGYGERAVYLEEENRTDETVEYSTWKEKTAAGGISLPLNFSRGIHGTFINISVEGGYIEISDKDNENYSIYEDIESDGNLKYMTYSLDFTHNIQGAMNSLGPKYGQVINASFSHTPRESDYRGRILSVDSKLYFPGLTDTHSLLFSGSYEYNDYVSYLFPGTFLFPRGYDSVRHERFFKGGIDYSMPLINVSIPLWKLVYIKRFIGTVFYDYGAGITGGEKTLYRSAGVEITAEQNLLSNVYLQIEAGMRYSRCFETDENVYEFVLKVPMY